MKRTVPTLLAVALFGLANAVSAQQQVTIYRCTDANGALLLQNDEPCPAGYKQQAQVVDVPPPLPPYIPREQRMPDVVAAEEAAHDAAVAKALPKQVSPEARVAPPALFQCRTWENNAYLTESESPAERCAPMRVVGLDGRPRPGLGSACQKTVDTCEAVAEDALCAAWRRRVDEAEFRWKFAGGRPGDPKRVDYERLAATLANSTCAG